MKTRYRSRCDGIVLRFTLKFRGAGRVGLIQH